MQGENILLRGRVSRSKTKLSKKDLRATGSHLVLAGRIAALALAGALALPAGIAHAQDATWTGDASGDISDPANWVGGIVPTGMAYFGASGNTALSSSIDGTVFMQGWTFTAGAPAYSYDVTLPAALYFDGVGIVNDSSSIPTLNNDWDLTFARGATAANAVINNSGSGLVVFKDGSTADRATINNLTSTATVEFDNGSGLGTALINNSGTLGIGSSSAENARIFNNHLVHFYGAGTGGNAAIQNYSGGEIRFDGSSTGGNAVITNDAGAVVDFSESSGPNNDHKLSIGAIIGGGNVYLGSNALSIGGTDQDITLSGVFSDCGASGTDCHIAGATGGSLVKVGAGTLTITNTDTYTGGTTISAGKLQIGNAGTAGRIDGDVTVGSGTTFSAVNGNLNGIVHIDNSGITEFHGNTSPVNALITNNADGVVDFSGSTGLAGDGQLTAGEIEGAGNFYLGSNTLTLHTGQNTTVSGVISDCGAGGTACNTPGATGGALVKAGSGQLTFTGANTYTGGTAVNGGLLILGDTTAQGSVVGDVTVGATGNLQLVNTNLGAVTAIDNAGLVFFRNSTDAGNIALNNSGTLSFTGNSTAGNAAITNDPGGTVDFTTSSGPNGGHKLSAGSIAGAGNFILGANELTTGSNNLSTEVSGVISGTSGSLVKTGSGALTLTGANTYTGGTTIANGTLQLGNSAAAGSILGDVIDNGVLAFDRSDVLTFTGDISGTGAVNQIGTGTTILTGADSYTGGTTISDGTLQIGDGGTAGSIVGNVIDNGALAFNRSDALTFAGDISGTGAVNQIGSGTTILTGTGSYTGDTTISAGTLQFGDGSSGGINNLGGNLTVAGGTLAIRKPAILTVADSVVLADGTMLSTDARLGAASLVADNVSIGNGVALNISGIDAASQTDSVLIDTHSGIAGDFGTVGVGGSAGTVDYLILSTRKSADNRQYLASYGLNWTANNSLAHGTFTLTNPSDAFTVGMALTDQAANPATGWDGRSLTKAGAGTLTLAADNTYTGGTTITAGTLRIGNGGTTGSITGDVLDNGTLVFDRADALTFAGAISGAGDLRQIGSGKTILTGNSGGFSGETTVESGTLAVNGSLGGTLDVLSGGRLQGSGTVGGTTVSGTVAPGNSIGTLNVAGNILFNPGSIYEVEVDAAGQADRIAASGTATINGGAVNVLAGAGSYAPATTYTILSAGGGRTGTFTGGVTSNLAFLNPSLSYDANSVYLTMTRNSTTFRNVGLTRNQIETGSGVESLGSGNAVYDAVLGLSAPQAQNAFDQLSGEVHASAKTAMLEDSRFLRNAVNDRLRAASGSAGASGGSVTTYKEGKPVAAAATTDGLAIWGQGFGSWGHWNGDGNAARLDRSIGGVFIGADAPVFDTWRLGAVAGYSNTSFDVKDRQSSGSSDNYHLGLYGGTSWGGLAFRSGATYTWHDVSTNRAVAFPGFSDSLKGDYNAGTAQAFGELGYGIDTSAARFEPFGNLAYVSVHTDSFTEKGGAAALSSESDTTDATFTTLGLRASTGFDMNGAQVTAKGMLGWRHAFGDITPLSAMRFAGGGDAFSIGGIPIAQNAAVIEAGLDVALTQTATIGVSYAGQFGSGITDQSVKASFNVKF